MALNGNEARLIELAAAGDEHAVDEIVHELRPEMLRQARLIVGTVHAEDVVQIALANAFEAIGAGFRPYALRPWLATVTRNAALSELRAMRPVEPEADLSVRPAADAVIERDEVRRLTAAIRDLPDRERAALVAREFEGLGHTEIAARQGISEGSARMDIHRARERLRAAFGVFSPLPLLALLRSATGRVRDLGWAGAGAGAGATVASAVVLAAAVAGGGGSGPGGNAATANTGGNPAVADAGAGSSQSADQRGDSKPDKPEPKQKQDSPVSAPEPAPASPAAAPPATTPAPTPAAPPAEPAPQSAPPPEQSPSPPQQNEPNEPAPTPDPAPTPEPPPAAPPPAAPPTPTPSTCGGPIRCVLEGVGHILGVNGR
jgi:RNA polymerase sigma factor (sigma-70 family)